MVGGVKCGVTVNAYDQTTGVHEAMQKNNVTYFPSQPPTAQTRPSSRMAMEALPGWLVLCATTVFSMFPAFAFSIEIISKVALVEGMTTTVSVPRDHTDR